MRRSKLLLQAKTQEHFTYRTPCKGSQREIRQSALFHLHEVQATDTTHSQGQECEWRLPSREGHDHGEMMRPLGGCLHRCLHQAVYAFLHIHCISASVFWKVNTHVRQKNNKQNQKNLTIKGQAVTWERILIHTVDYSLITTAWGILPISKKKTSSP